MNILQKASSVVSACAVLFAILSPAPVLANENDIARLIQNRQFDEAALKLDRLLLERPNDAQLRFMKGLVLHSQNKREEAIVVFTKLTHDFPDLAEPYNNLGVLFAAGGEYPKAAASLEMAIRLNPNYVTARENLGDVYLRLASMTYEKATQIGGHAETTQGKLKALRTLVPKQDSPEKVASTSPAPATPAQPQPSVQSPAPEMNVVSAAADKKSVNAADIEDVTKTIHSWAKAWSAKDVKTYLAFYAPDFEPADGESRKAWEQKRRVRVGKAGNIDLRIDALEVSAGGNDAIAKFRQRYISNNVKSEDTKVLVLTKGSGAWQIKRERITD